MTEQLTAQLIATRASLKAALALIEAELAHDVVEETAATPPPVPEEPGVCRHHEELRVAAPRMGFSSAWVCAKCQHNEDGPAN